MPKHCTGRSTAIPPTAPIATPADARDAAVLPAGARIGDHEVLSLLAVGELGVTYLAEHVAHRTPCVLKEYLPRAIACRDAGQVRARPMHAAAYAWGLDRFVLEARALQGISHPGLVEVRSVELHGGTGYVITGREQGRTFDAWLDARQRIASQEALDGLLEPLLEGLAMAHHSGVLHLDLDPDSIIVREDGSAVVADLGAHRAGLRRRLPAGQRTTQRYAAPELEAASSGPIGPWTDVFALAGLLHLAVTGQPPLSARARAAGAAMPSATTAAQGSYRAGFMEAIDWGLQLAPELRPRSLTEWRRRLLGRRSPCLRLPSRRRPSATAAAARPAGEPGRAPEARGIVSCPLRALSLAGAGLVGGGAAGALSSVAIAGALRADCGAELCAAPFVLPLALIGAAIGCWEGIRLGRKRASDRALSSG